VVNHTVLITDDSSEAGVGEEVHEEVHGAEAEALVVVPGQRRLQLPVVDHPAPVAVRRLEARHDGRVRPRRERRRHQRREHAAAAAVGIAVRMGWPPGSRFRHYCRTGNRRPVAGTSWPWVVN
jgi:hypothetical protein